MRQDFIHLFLGMSRRGKTTRALENLGPSRSICYSAQFTNEKMIERYKGRFIYDDPQYLSNLDKYLDTYKDILILKRSKDNEVFQYLTKIQNCEILIDDVTMILDDNWPFVSFLSSVGMNNNKCLLTTHVPRGDM